MPPQPSTEHKPSRVSLWVAAGLGDERGVTRGRRDATRPGSACRKQYVVFLAISEDRRLFAGSRCFFRAAHSLIEQDCGRRYPAVEGGIAVEFDLMW